MYSGWSEVTPGSYETVGKVACAGFEPTPEFTKIREAHLLEYYDADDIEVRVLNGDGAAWVKASGEDAIVQLDPFHLKRAIMRWATDSEARSKINALLKNKDIDGVLSYVANLVESAADEPTTKRLKGLYSYLNENREHLTPWKERGIELPAPPEGIVYRRGGAQSNKGYI